MMALSNTKVRIVTAAVVAPFAMLCFINYYSALGLVSAVVMIATYEYLAFSLKKEEIPTLRLAICAVVVLSTIFYGLILAKMGTAVDPSFRPELVFVMSMITISALTLVGVSDISKAKLFITNGAFSLIYISFNLSFFFPIYIQFGGFIALTGLIAVWVFDIGAFFVGCRLGKIRISPTYSPKKSLEGVVGGYIFTLLFMVLFVRIGSWLGLYEISAFGLVDFAILAFVISFFGTLGDVTESALKRFHGVKDSGDTLPGHGGMLDRIDGLLFATPVFYVFLNILS